MEAMALAPVIGSLWLHLDLSLKIALNRALRRSNQGIPLAEYTASFPLRVEIHFNNKPIMFTGDRFETAFGTTHDPDTMLFPWEIDDLMLYFSNIEVIVKSNLLYHEMSDSLYQFMSDPSFQNKKLINILTSPKVRSVILLTVPKLDLGPIASKVKVFRGDLGNQVFFENLIHLSVCNDHRQRTIRWDVQHLSQLRVLKLFLVDQLEPLSLPSSLRELHLMACKIRLNCPDELYFLEILDVTHSTVDVEDILQKAPTVSLLRISGQWSWSRTPPTIEKLAVNLLEMSQDFLPRFGMLDSPYAIGHAITHLQVGEFDAHKIDLNHFFPFLKFFSVIDYIGDILKHNRLTQLNFTAELPVRLELPMLEDLEVSDGIVPSNIPYENLMKLAFTVSLGELHLPPSPKLLNLDVTCCKLRHINIDACPNLRELYLEDNEFELISITHPNLQLVRMSDNLRLSFVTITSPAEFVDLSDTPLLRYAKLPNTIRDIKLDRTSPSLDGGPWPLVTQLKCFSSGIIEWFPQLKYLDMNYGYRDLDLLPRTLKQLTLQGPSEVDLTCLQSMDQLEVLEILTDVLVKDYRLSQSLRVLALNVTELPLFNWEGQTNMEFIRVCSRIEYSDNDMRRKLSMGLHPPNVVLRCQVSSGV